MIIATPARHDSASKPAKPGDLDVVGECNGNTVIVGVSFKLLKSFTVIFAMSVGSGVTVTVT